MSTELAHGYRDLRRRIIDATADLDDDTARSTMVPCTPEWSIHGLLSHLAGVPADILIGNTEAAATVEWADGHVADRVGHSFEDVRVELVEAGAGVDEVLETAAGFFPPQFFLDAWTHEADLMHALGLPGPGDLRLVGATFGFMADNVGSRLAEAGLGPVTLAGLDEERVAGADGGIPGSLTTDPFEFLRCVLGRRSAAQLAALDWSGVDPTIAGPCLVAWTPNDVDIIEIAPTELVWPTEEVA